MAPAAGAALMGTPGAGSPVCSEPGPGLPPRISRGAEVWNPAGRIRARFPGAAGSCPGTQGAQGPQLRVPGKGRRRDRHQSRSSGGVPRWPVLLRGAVVPPRRGLVLLVCIRAVMKSRSLRPSEQDPSCRWLLGLRWGAGGPCWHLLSGHRSSLGPGHRTRPPCKAGAEGPGQRQLLAPGPRHFPGEGGPCPCSWQWSLRMVGDSLLPRPGPQAWAAQRLCPTAAVLQTLSNEGPSGWARASALRHQVPAHLSSAGCPARCRPRADAHHPGSWCREPRPPHLPGAEAKETAAAAPGVQVIKWSRFLGHPHLQAPVQSCSWGAGRPCSPEGFTPHGPRPGALLQGTGPFTFPGLGSLHRGERRWGHVQVLRCPGLMQRLYAHRAGVSGGALLGPFLCLGARVSWGPLGLLAPGPCVAHPWRDHRPLMEPTGRAPLCPPKLSARGCVPHTVGSGMCPPKP